MIFLVKDILEAIGEKLDGAGVDYSCSPEENARVFAAYNKITRVLMRYGEWQGAEADICLPVCDCCVTLDRRIETIKTAQLYGQRLEIYSRGFKYLEGGTAQ